MDYQEDWILRQIEGMMQFIAKTIFNKSTIKYTVADEQNLSQTDFLYNNIMDLLAKFKICEAEDCLFENLDSTNTVSLEAALDFYQNLNKLTDEQLETHNFSREEVRDGINAVMRRFNLSEFDLGI